ncbi:hypothetical protein LJR130_006708 [Variovorax sp. LjRoot130]|uniref:hypothetical protein n=1 Tax=Variovorax sp. LjRoot130 TaxID=3342261 RepID=UPI003ECF5ABB
MMTFTSMSKHTLFAYVDGADLHEIADSLEKRLDAFAREGDWRVAAPLVVNRRGTDDGLRAGDLPSWDLGLNLALPDVGQEPDRWFADVERITVFLGTLHSAFGRDFVIGIADNVTGIAEDLFFVESAVPSLDKPAPRGRRWGRRLASAACGHQLPLVTGGNTAYQLGATVQEVFEIYRDCDGRRTNAVVVRTATEATPSCACTTHRHRALLPPRVRVRGDAAVAHPARAPGLVVPASRRRCSSSPPWLIWTYIT